MHERFSDRARHALALANLEAGKLKHNYLAPAHILLGLIAEGKSVAIQTLRLLDVDLDKMRDQVRARMEVGTDQGGMGLRTQTKETKEVIATAIDEARKFNHKYVGTEHLILALLSQPRSVAYQVLTENGASIESLREKTLQALQAGPGPADDLAHSRHGYLEWVHQQELAKAFRSPEFWHTMILAVDSANRMGSGEIEPTHLLMALLCDESTDLVQKLKEKGVTQEWLKEMTSS